MRKPIRAAAWLSLAAVSVGCSSKTLSSPYEPQGSGGESGQACSAPSIGAWSTLADSEAPAARASPSAFWTGSEMLVWGGYTGSLVADGALYDPERDTWRPMSTAGAPLARANAGVAWTGNELVVWGGFDEDGELLMDGASYDVQSDTWTELPTDGAPSPRAVGLAVWTGTHVIFWGGATFEGALATGARFDPVNRAWTPVSTLDAPEARNVYGGVWTGSELLVWGGFSSGRPVGSGGRYDPLSDTWRPITTEDAPSPRTSIQSSVVWTGDRMFVWGGHNGSFEDGIAYQDGALYDPATDSWTAISAECPPEARAGHTAVWTGSRVLVWGGQLGNLPTYPRLSSGSAYDPVRDAWSELAPAPLRARDEHVLVWTGTEALVWGGYSGEASGSSTEYGDGARLTP